jgi:hypothetical protein
MVLAALRASCTSLGVGDGLSIGIPPALIRVLLSTLSPPRQGPSMAFLSVPSCALVCSISASWAIKARRRTTSRYPINCGLTLSSSKWSASSYDFVPERKSDHMRASEPAGGGTYGSAVSHSSRWQERTPPHVRKTREERRKKWRHACSSSQLRAPRSVDELARGRVPRSVLQWVSELAGKVPTRQANASSSFSSSTRSPVS